MNSEINVEMIIPTVMIPLTLIGVGISVVATFVASLFGVQLKAEGPKKLLELFLKPKIIFLALIFNAVGWGLFKGWLYWKNYPRLLSTIHRHNEKNLQSSEKKYEDYSQDLNKAQRPRVSIGSVPLLEQSWSLDISSGAFSAPVISSHSVFVGTREGFVKEVDLESGALIRNFFVGSPVTSKVSLWKNSLYVGEGVHDLHHARVYKFDLGTSRLVGSYQTKGHIEAQSVIAESEGRSLLFVPAGADGLHAVDPESMKGVWKANHGHTDSSVVVEKGVVFMGTGREKDDDKKNRTYAVALNFQDASLKWKHELPGSSWLTPTTWNNEVCFVVGEVYFVVERGHVVCFDQKTGEHRTAINVDEPIVALPLVLNDSLYFSGVNGSIYSYDMREKKMKWSHKGTVDGVAYAGPSYDSSRDVIVYPTYNEGVKIYDPENGTLLSQWTPKSEDGEWSKNYAGAAIENGTWVFADYKKTLRALRSTPTLKTTKRLAEKNSSLQ